MIRTSSKWEKIPDTEHCGIWFVVIGKRVEVTHPDGESYYHREYKWKILEKPTTTIPGYMKKFKEWKIWHGHMYDTDE